MPVEIVESSYITIKYSSSGSLTNVTCGGSASNFKVYDIGVVVYNNSDTSKIVYLLITDTSESKNYGISNTVSLGPFTSQFIWLGSQPTLPTFNSTIRIIAVDYDTNEKSNRCDFFHEGYGGYSIQSVTINGQSIVNNQNITFQLDNINGNNVKESIISMRNNGNVPSKYFISVIHPNGYTYSGNVSLFYLDEIKSLSSLIDFNRGSGTYKISLQHKMSDESVEISSDINVNVTVIQPAEPPPPPNDIALQWVDYYVGDVRVDTVQCGVKIFDEPPTNIRAQIYNNTQTEKQIALRWIPPSPDIITTGDYESLPSGASAVRELLIGTNFNTDLLSHRVEAISSDGIVSNGCDVRIQSKPIAEISYMNVNGVQAGSEIIQRGTTVSIEVGIKNLSSYTRGFALGIIPGPSSESVFEVILQPGGTGELSLPRIIQDDTIFEITIWSNSIGVVASDSISITSCSGSGGSTPCCQGLLDCNGTCQTPTEDGCCSNDIVCDGTCTTPNEDGCCPGLTLCPNGECEQSCGPAPCQSEFILCNNQCAQPTSEGCCPGETRCSDNICRAYCGTIATHFECKDQKCVEVHGLGTDQCEGIGINVPCKCSGFMLDNFCVNQYMILGIGGIFTLMITLGIVKKILR